MITAGGTNLPKGEEPEVVDIGDGVYIVVNSYTGPYEYFDGRPIEQAQNSSASESDAILLPEGPATQD